MSSNAQIQVRLAPELAQGVRADGLMANSDYGTIILDFFTALPGMQAPEVVARVVLSPEHLSPVVECMEIHRRAYEERFGPIPKRPQPEQAVVFSVAGAKS